MRVLLHALINTTKILNKDYVCRQGVFRYSQLVVAFYMHGHNQAQNHNSKVK